jgi:hypothetical protein
MTHTQRRDLMDKTTFDLEATDAAMIFHSDMGTELILPKMDDEETVEFDTHQNIFVAMAIVSLLDDDEFRTFVQNKLEVMLETADALKEGDEDTVDVEAEACPAGGCSCCSVTHEEDPGDGS